MTKFIIVTGRKSFSNYFAQSNYWIIQTKLLTTIFKNNNETKEYSKFVKTQKWFPWFKFKKKACLNEAIRRENMLIKFKEISKRLISKEGLVWVGGVSFAGKSFDSVLILASWIFQCFKYAYIFHILVFIYVIWFVCLVLWSNEQSHIQNYDKHPRAFCEYSYRLKKLNLGFLIGL